MTDKHGFASDAWLAALEQHAQELLDAKGSVPQTAFTYSESFSDAPMARPDGRAPGYILRFAGNTASVLPGVQGDEAADCTVVMDYAAAFASTRLPAGPELDALGRQAFAAGKLQMTGSLAGFPIEMNRLHNAMVACTRPSTDSER